MSTPVSTDTYLVNRGGSSFTVTQENIMAELQDTDLLLVNRANASYKITGADFKASVVTNAPPEIFNAVLSEDSVTGDRFTNQSFTTSFNMTNDGTPASGKYLKPYVQGALSKYGVTSPITDVTAAAVQLYVWDGAAPTDLADVEANGTAVPFASQGNLTAATQCFILVNKAITASRDGDDVFTGNGTTSFSLTVSVNNGGAYDAAGNRLGGAGGYNSSEWTLQKWDSDIANIDNGYTFYTGAAYYILGNSGSVSSGSSGLPDYTGATLLTLTNDQDLDYFEVGDVVTGQNNSGGVTDPKPATVYVGNSGAYANDPAQWGMVLAAGSNPPATVDGTTNPWVYFGGELATFTFTGTAPIYFYCSTESGSAGSGTVTGDVSATTFVIPSGTTGSALGNFVLYPTSDGGTFTLNPSGYAYTYAISGSVAVQVTEISPEVPSMGVSGGTWVVGDVVTNTVERQEMVNITTSNIVSQGIRPTETQPDYWAEGSIPTFPTGTFDNVAAQLVFTQPSAQVGIGFYPNYGVNTSEPIFEFGTPIPFTTLRIFRAGYWSAAAGATVYVNGVLISSLENGGVNEWTDETANVTSPLTSISFGNSDGYQSIAKFEIDGVELTTGASFPGSPFLTFTDDTGLADFTAGMAIKQNAPVTPVTSVITDVTGNTLTFLDNTQLDNFQDGDVLTVTNPGETVVSVTPASNQMEVSGGTWTNGDVVTGQVIDGTGNVKSTDPSANTMDINSGRFAIGSKVESVNKVPNPAAKLYCTTLPNGQIVDLVSADPGYTNMDSTALTQQVTFPPVFSTGQTPDQELPAGTSLVCDVKAQNDSGQSTATTNLVTPT